jgi:hypothetical protein
MSLISRTRLFRDSRRLSDANKLFNYSEKQLLVRLKKTRDEEL